MGGFSLACSDGENYYKFYEENRIDNDSCKRGLLVKPEAGDGILFYSQTPDYTLDPNSLHGGCPVSKGEKWVATKWMHNAKYVGSPTPCSQSFPSSLSPLFPFALRSEKTEKLPVDATK